jgi:hydroxymethylpyrimidine pyrophosphatase-like HAD family hydrolase
MKLVVVDVDGTLIDSPKQKVPSDDFVQIVQEIKEKVLVTCATGRSASWARPVLEKAEFTAPPIIGGGALILNPTTLQPEHEYYLPQGQLDNIKAVLRNYPDSRVLFDDYTEDEYLNGGWDLERLLSSDSCYIMEVIQLSHERADELIERFAKIEGVTSIKMSSLKPGFVDIHVVNELSTKEHAIVVLQEELGI